MLTILAGFLLQGRAMRVRAGASLSAGLKGSAQQQNEGMEVKHGSHATALQAEEEPVHGSAQEGEDCVGEDSSDLLLHGPTKVCAPNLRCLGFSKGVEPKMGTCGYCEDDKGWKDNTGKGCADYPDVWCLNADEFGAGARIACCKCGGGHLGQGPPAPTPTGQEPPAQAPATPRAPCTWQIGTGYGGHSKDVGTFATPEECEQAVMAHHPRANGATYSNVATTGNAKGHCEAVYGWKTADRRYNTHVTCSIVPDYSAPTPQPTTTPPLTWLSRPNSYCGKMDSGRDWQNIFKYATLEECQQDTRKGTPNQCCFEYTGAGAFGAETCSSYTGRKGNIYGGSYAVVDPVTRRHCASDAWVLG